jgi:hypothetical protein
VGSVAAGLDWAEGPRCWLSTGGVKRRSRVELAAALRSGATALVALGDRRGLWCEEWVAHSREQVLRGSGGKWVWENGRARGRRFTVSPALMAWRARARAQSFSDAWLCCGSALAIVGERGCEP